MAIIGFLIMAALIWWLPPLYILRYGFQCVRAWHSIFIFPIYYFNVSPDDKLLTGSNTGDMAVSFVAVLWIGIINELLRRQFPWYPHQTEAEWKGTQAAKRHQRRCQRMSVIQARLDRMKAAKAQREALAAQQASLEAKKAQKDAWTDYLAQRGLSRGLPRRAVRS